MVKSLIIPTWLSTLTNMLDYNDPELSLLTLERPRLRCAPHTVHSQSERNIFQKICSAITFYSHRDLGGYFASDLGYIASLLSKPKDNLPAADIKLPPRIDLEEKEEMSEENEIIVEIPQGRLRGKKDKSVFGLEFYCFHRIPYAKPPVGELRFKAPRPAEGWSGIRDATQEGATCPSTDWSKFNFLKESKEDSLFINVYCKQMPKAEGRKKYPVMIWFHGGGFELGSGNRNICGPDYLLLHDVILVTFNYRLGVLECPGNFGLKDQQLALNWVKKNIIHFGGDPDNITIFGISAGGASVHYQTLSLSNEGLFKRAIIQSGAAINRWAYSRRPRENAFALGKRLGCDTKDDKVLLGFLRKASVEDIVLNGVGLINETEGESLGEHFLSFTFVPTAEPEHEGAFISKHPWDLMKEGRYLDVPLITGILSKEMILGVRGVDDYPRFTEDEEFQLFIPRGIQLPKGGEKALAIAKRIKEFYFKDGINLTNYIDILSDSFFNYGVFKHVKCRTTNKNIKTPTYLYEFSYEGDQSFIKRIFELHNIKGACHGDDTGYFFKTEFSNTEKMRPHSRDYNFMIKLTKLWTNYAKTGEPTLDESEFFWPKTSYKDLEYLDIGEQFVRKKGLLRDRMEFWEEIYTSFYDHKV